MHKIYTEEELQARQRWDRWLNNVWHFLVGAIAVSAFSVTVAWMILATF